MMDFNRIKEVVHDKSIGNSKHTLHELSRVIAGLNLQPGKYDHILEQRKRREVIALQDSKVRATRESKVHKQWMEVLGKQAEFLKDVITCEDEVKQLSKERSSMLDSAMAKRRDTTRLDAKIDQFVTLGGVMGEYKKYLLLAIDLFTPFAVFIREAAELYCTNPDNLINRHLTLVRVYEENHKDVDIVAQELARQRHAMVTQKAMYEKNTMLLTCEVGEAKDYHARLEHRNIADEIALDSAIGMSTGAQKVRYRQANSIENLYKKLMLFRDLLPEKQLGQIEMLNAIETHYLHLHDTVEKLRTVTMTNPDAVFSPGVSSVSMPKRMNRTDINKAKAKRKNAAPKVHPVKYFEPLAFATRTSQLVNMGSIRHKIKKQQQTLYSVKEDMHRQNQTSQTVKKMIKPGTFMPQINPIKATVESQPTGDSVNVSENATNKNTSENTNVVTTPELSRPRRSQTLPREINVPPQHRHTSNTSTTHKAKTKSQLPPINVRKPGLKRSNPT